MPVAMLLILDCCCLQINRHLAGQVYLCGTRLTLADLVIFCALHRPVVCFAKLPSAAAMSTYKA